MFDVTEAIWGLVVLGLGLVAADYYLVRRSTDRAIDRILERPALRQLNKLSLSRDFELFVVDTISSIGALNKFIRDDLPQIKESLKGLDKLTGQFIMKKPKKEK